MMTLRPSRQLRNARNFKQQEPMLDMISAMRSMIDTIDILSKSIARGNKTVMTHIERCVNSYERS